MSDDVFPDRDMPDHEKIAWVVETQRWCAVPVAPVQDPPTPAYTYTVGFETAWQHPEVVVFGLAPIAARGLLLLLVEQLSAGGNLLEGTFIGLLDDEQRCAILPIGPGEVDEMFPAADAFFGDEDYRMSQFVWPDKTGNLPWEPEFEERLRLAQPVLGSV
jgi:hypothetical protein